MISQFAHNEQNMNSVERVMHYAELPSEGALKSTNDPDPSWPQNGEIDFKNVDLAYRPGLPLVLKRVSFSVRPREKVRFVLPQTGIQFSTHSRSALLGGQDRGKVLSCRHCFGN